MTYYTWESLQTGDGWYFRYRTKNVLGWSSPSPVMFYRIGTEPDQMNAPTVEIDADPTKILINWTALSESVDGGIGIQAYIIEIEGKDNDFFESADCDGSSLDAIADLSCRVSLTTLL